MFERMTDRARRVIVLAQEEARQLHHNYIGTEHILLGVIREDEGTAATALKSLEVSPENVRDRVVAVIGIGLNIPTGHIPFTPRGKKVLELALREALRLGHNYIGPEHILLGIIREGEGIGASVLTDVGADLAAVRQEVVRVINASVTGQSPDRVVAADRAVRAAQQAVIDAQDKLIKAQRAFIAAAAEVAGQ